MDMMSSVKDCTERVLTEVTRSDRSISSALPGTWASAT